MKMRNPASGGGQDGGPRLMPPCRSPPSVIALLSMKAPEGSSKAQLTVRNLDRELVRRLKIRAAEHNRSAEAEHRAILEAALRSPEAGFWEQAATMRRATRGRKATDSTVLVRYDRERDG